MEQVRCTNCGSAAIIPSESGEFCKCEACGSTFSVKRGAEFFNVRLDHTQDVRAWREYLAKQLRLQQDSSKARDYGGVKLFAQKILSVLPDDFCARYYVALAERESGNDTAFIDFTSNAGFDGVTPEERREVTTSLVASVTPKYLDATKAFIARAYPETCDGFDQILDRNIKQYIQKLRYAKTTDRDVFICHRTAEPDCDIADAICTRLEERGLRCWIAPRNILAGSQNYERDILKGVENCRLFLLVSSFKSIYSEDCEMELKAAVLADKALYSYRIDDTPYDGAFEKALSSVQWLDAQDDPYSHLEQLVIDVKGILADDERIKSELEEKRLAAREKERIITAAQRSKEQERLDRLERIVQSGVAATAVSAPPTGAVRAKLRRAEAELQAENYERASKIVDELLDIDPECAEAWWLLILCDYHKPSDAELVASGIDFTAHRYFKNVERFTDDEPQFERRLQDAVASFKTRVVREVNKRLDEAERLMNADNFTGMASVLDKCVQAFSDEKSMVFSRFPDVASRYYWLKLWAKYGQTKLVCVEDITRETEYKNAVRYASPAQAKEYAEARETVSKNAQLFLRERSKNKNNDGKLTDYLVDNKNILPLDVYNHYSSLLYFRKMLKTLNMTEQQLADSTVDITTNEYFMLASSMATDSQKREYDALTARIDRNRTEKAQRGSVARANRYDVRDSRAGFGKSAKTRAGAIGVAVAMGIQIIIMLCSITAITEHGFDDCLEAFISFVFAATFFRLIADSFNLCTTNRGFIAVTAVDLFLSIFTYVASIMSFIVIGATAQAILALIFGLPCLILEKIKLKQIDNNSTKNNG